MNAKNSAESLGLHWGGFGSGYRTMPRTRIMTLFELVHMKILSGPPMSTNKRFALSFAVSTVAAIATVLILHF